MHYEVKQFIQYVKKCLPHKFRLRKVLEVGSQNINGSPRGFFWFCWYTGVDLMKGKGVDLVGDFSTMDFSLNRFGVVISSEMLEHDKNWQISLKKMYDALEDGGLLIITCAGPKRPEHGTKRTSPESSPATTDYYGNIYTEDFEKILPRHWFSEYVLQYARGDNDLQFYGIKKKLKTPTSAEIYKALIDSAKRNIGNYSLT